MGYESRFYIVEKFDNPREEDGRVYASAIAHFDLCKVYDLSDKFRTMPATNCYIYNPGSDDEVLEDCYGEPLKECSVIEAIAFVKEAIKADKYDYWRYNMFLGALKEVLLSLGEKCCNNGPIAVLHYGY